MAEQVEAAALVEAAAEFLGEAGKSLEGRQAFHARVAANALAIVARELRQRPAEAEAAALARLLGHDAPLDTLRAEACNRLRSGLLRPDDGALLATLTDAVLAKVAVDNPRYSTFARMRDGAG